LQNKADEVPAASVRAEPEICECYLLPKGANHKFSVEKAHLLLIIFLKFPVPDGSGVQYCLALDGGSLCSVAEFGLALPC
jgi:hypothetical protein